MAGGVAILGAGGFVGARFVELAVLDGRSDEVIPIVRAAKSVARTAHLGLTYRFGDASRPDSLARALEGCEAVVDLTKGNPADMPRIAESVHAAALAARVRVLVPMTHSPGSTIGCGTRARRDAPRTSCASGWATGA